MDNIDEFPLPVMDGGGVLLPGSSNVSGGSGFYDDTATANDDTTDDIGKPWPAWKQPLYGVVLLSVAYIAVAVIGVLNNGLVVAVIYSRPAMRTVTNYFLANLAIADILVCVVVLPITLLQNIFTEWWHGPTVCRIAPYLQGVSVGASVNTLAAVAFERYLAIFYPSTSKMSPRTAAIVVCVIWLFPMLLFIPWLFVYRQQTFVVHGRYDYVACHAVWPSERLERGFTLGAVFLTCYLVPLACIGVFYVRIGTRVWHRRVGQLSTESRAAASIRRSKSRLLRMLVTVVALFAASWLPLYGVYLRRMLAATDGGLGPRERAILEGYVGPLAQWLGASNSCVNPFVYCYFSRSFRTGIYDLLRATVAVVCPWSAVGRGGAGRGQSVMDPGTRTRTVVARQTVLQQQQQEAAAGQHQPCVQQRVELCETIALRLSSPLPVEL